MTRTADSGSQRHFDRGNPFDPYNGQSLPIINWCDASGGRPAISVYLAFDSPLRKLLMPRPHLSVDVILLGAVTSGCVCVPARICLQPDGPVCCGPGAYLEQMVSSGYCLPPCATSACCHPDCLPVYSTQSCVPGWRAGSTVSGMPRRRGASGSCDTDSSGEIFDAARPPIPSRHPRPPDSSTAERTNLHSEPEPWHGGASNGTTDVSRMEWHEKRRTAFA